MTYISRRAMIGGAALLVATGTAHAQPGPGMTRGGGPGFGRGMNDPASYLAALKSDLRIMPSQEKAWTEYAETVQGMASQMQSMHASVFQSMQTATWEERQAMMNTMFATRDAAHQSVKMAADKLMTQLTPAQRSKAQTALPGLIGPGPGGRGMGRGMGAGRGMGPGGGAGMGPGGGAGMGSGGGPGMMNNASPPTGSTTQ